jgi:DNA-binding NtrC family response regulator
LRERPKDILALARHFARKYADANGMPFRPLAGETERMLLSHGWKGNVRELENTIHRAVLLSQGGEISPDSIRLPDGARLPEGGGATRGPDIATAAAATALTTRTLVGRTVSDVERDLILDTLDHCLGNRTHAANILGISIRTLRNKLREYSQAGIRVAQPGEARASGG